MTDRSRSIAGAVVVAVSTWLPIVTLPGVGALDMHGANGEGPVLLALALVAAGACLARLHLVAVVVGLVIAGDAALSLLDVMGRLSSVPGASMGPGWLAALIGAGLLLWGAFAGNADTTRARTAAEAAASKVASERRRRLEARKVKA